LNGKAITVVEDVYLAYARTHHRELSGDDSGITQELPGRWAFELVGVFANEAVVAGAVPGVDAAELADRVPTKPVVNGKPTAVGRYS
jgi:hypothetical protein